MELWGRLHAAEEDVPMVTSEMEAAEALAGLACCSAVRGACLGSDELEIPSQNHAEESTEASSLRPTQEAAVATVYESNSATKLRQSLTEAEKEAQRLRRVLANRESARKTIRRRQAMHQELTRKLAHLAEENKDLKREEERVVEEYNSLKSRNEFLKLLMADVKKAEPRESETEPVKSAQRETSTSATITTPILLYNHPSLVPCILPSIASSNVIQFQFPLQDKDKDLAPPLHQGNPLFILPVPCLFPIGVTPHSCSDTNRRHNEMSSKHECSVSSSTVSTECSLKVNINNRDANSSPHVTQRSVKKNHKPNICSHGRRADVFAAAEARRRRKELMGLKDIRYRTRNR